MHVVLGQPCLQLCFIDATNDVACFFCFCACLQRNLQFELLSEDLGTQSLDELFKSPGLWITPAELKLQMRQFQQPRKYVAGKSLKPMFAANSSNGSGGRFKGLSRTCGAGLWVLDAELSLHRSATSFGLMGSTLVPSHCAGSVMCTTLMHCVGSL
eukprot:4492739-Amphidinium_carterae.1